MNPPHPTHSRSILFSFLKRLIDDDFEPSSLCPDETLFIPAATPRVPHATPAPLLVCSIITFFPCRI
jgi:hypothetical protein